MFILISMFIFHMSVQTADSSESLSAGFTHSFTSMNFSVIVPRASIGKGLPAVFTIIRFLLQQTCWFNSPEG